MDRSCIACGDSVKGRSDKKFCSDYCRNAFNNNLNKDRSKLIRNTNNRLRKNHRILQGYSLQNGTAKTTQAKLKDQGFSFTYHTHLYTTQKGSVYHFIYDLGYLLLENEAVMIVKREQ